ncbi:MAG: hypothetical protein RIB93_23710 [Coleofasciculus sp. D1-CHI-01]|uniref:Uncharacterized protein n=1 Tax=Coleofasciculus chthonoplastes PCC 7420 TaxID=118168 RepID=B4VM46_9CYAN|nr:hypothetical protein [Coleofasciculus chthonoplastes]EDX76697.1 hypothetical protein MC7420_1700 [Coleofasciculus chthonoplastes PCC 7420]
MNKQLQKQAKEAAATHRQSLHKNLQHRIEVARANGNDALVRQLEAEASYLKLS